MKKIVVIVVMAIFISITAYAQMSEKTGPAAAEISEGDSTHKSKPVLLKKYNTPEQRKAAAAAEQDSTIRPPSRMELQMNPPAETPVTFPVK